jgi:alpha-ribazole phosphatase
MILKLSLVRHGETEWNAQHRYQGQSDVPLSDVGREQVGLLARHLRGASFDAIYASDLKRAWETASIIAAELGAEVIPDPRLREMRFGILEGLTFDEAQKKYPDVVAAWLKDNNHPPPEGETLDAFSGRVLSFLDDVQAKHEGQHLLLVAHGGPLSEMVRLKLGVLPERRWSFAMDNASLSELWLDDNGYPLLKKLNETGHLLGLKE